MAVKEEIAAVHSRTILRNTFLAEVLETIPKAEESEDRKPEVSLPFSKQCTSNGI